MNIRNEKVSRKKIAAEARSWSIARSLFLCLVAASFILAGSHGALGGPPCNPADYVNISSAGYNAVPPFVTKGEGKPNVLIFLANSEDLNEFAYKRVGFGRDVANPDMGYDPNTIYYGYFETDKMYTYTSNDRFETADLVPLDRTAHFVDKTTPVSGNFMNWLCMRKIDVLKKVLIGGKYNPRSTDKTDPQTLLTQGHGNAVPASWDYFKTYNNVLYVLDGDSSSGRMNILEDTDGDGIGDSVIWNSNQEVHLQIRYPESPSGVLHTFVDEYQSGSDDQVVYGLELLNVGGDDYEGGAASNRDGGYISIPVRPSSRNNFFTNIANADPEDFTPLGEGLYEAVRYFQGPEGAGSAYNAGFSNDPMVDTEPCAKNFVIIISSGNDSKDKNIPGTFFSSVAPSVTDPVFNVRTYMDTIEGVEGSPHGWTDEITPDEGTYYLEGVAYYSHINDLRPIKEGYQNLNIYTVHANFDNSPTAEDLLMMTSKWGGFEDSNGNQVPDLASEWDGNNDYLPDTYFPATDGPALEAQLTAAMRDILKRSSSGTAASILTTSGKGDAVIYQALFYPKTTTDKFGTDEVDWIGNLSSLWIDRYGNVREDTNGNMALDMTSDYIVKMDYDVVQGAIAYRYEDTNGNGLPDDNVSADDFKAVGGFLAIENVKSLWEAGKLLLNRNLSSKPRNIFVDYASPGYWDFNDTYASVWRDYLRAVDDTEAAKIINYLHGEGVSGYRSRTVTYKGTTGVWKMADIINSSPVAVGRPKENYDLIYGDYTYRKFFEKYRDRRVMVYVGANDGMLHAFNSGFYKAQDKQFYKNLDTSSTPPVYNNSSSIELGEEMWAYLPRQLLPHVKWLTQDTYEDNNHVYYVDLTAKVVDVRIFEGEFSDPDPLGPNPHPYGWGTVLIGAMRLGGRPMNICNAGVEETLSSAYFALDITNPEYPPQLLWTFVPPNNTLTTGFPGVARVLSRDNSGNITASTDKWFMVVGSGPSDFDSNSNINTGTLPTGELYVVELETGNLLRTFTTGNGIVNKGGFFSDTITVDANVYLRGDAVVDVIYSGQTYYDNTASTYKGKMYRLNTKNDPDVSQWALSTLLSMNEPITSAPSAALDGKGNLWVFYGTGKFIGSEDKNASDSGVFYGIKDKAKPWLSPYTNTVEVLKSDLFNVTNTTVDYGGNTVTSLEETVTSNNWSGLLQEIDAHDGWFIDHSAITTDDLYDSDPNLNLHLGERVISKPTVLGGLVIWPTYKPTQGTNSCVFEGDSNIYAVYYQTGTAYKSYVFGDEKVSQPSIVSRSKSLGYGMPSSIGATVTESGDIKGFSQQSTGSILEIEAISTYNLKPGLSGWKEDNL